MKDKSLYFISGVSGVGKTAVIPYLKSLLPANFEVHDFDEGGVPTGADHAWRIGRTREWINSGNQKSIKGVSLIVCGFTNPDEIKIIKKEFPNLDIRIILLDGEAGVIEQRLLNRNNKIEVKEDLERVVGSVDAFIENNTRFIPVLREICKKQACSIIDTTYLEPKIIADRLIELIK